GGGGSCRDRLWGGPATTCGEAPTASRAQATRVILVSQELERQACRHCRLRIAWQQIRKDPSVSIPFLDLKAQLVSIHPEVDAAIKSVLDTGHFILGEDVSAFEQEFASFCGTRECVGVDSGISALELPLRAWDIGPGDEVITVANTFIATVLAIRGVGATAVLVEADPQTYLLDPAAVEA